MKIIEFNNAEELKKFLEEKKKELKESEEKELPNYDKFIDLLLDLSKEVAGSGCFLEDVEEYRKHLHNASEERKHSFVEAFSLALDDVISDIMKLTAEHVVIHKVLSDFMEEFKTKEKVVPNKNKK